MLQLTSNYNEAYLVLTVKLVGSLHKIAGMHWVS